MATNVTDIDCQSVASSTSWYMLNEPEKFPKYPVILLTQDQYECIIKLLQQPQYSLQPYFWTLSEQPSPWETLISSKGQHLLWPLCHNWLGTLKIGLLKEGLSSADELYQTMFDAYQHLFKFTNSYTAIKTKVEKQAILFLLLTHLGDGKFRVSFRSKLKGLNTTTKSSKRIGKIHKFAPKDSRKDNMKGRIAVISKEIMNKSLPSSQLVNGPVKLYGKTGQRFLNILETALEQHERDDRIEYLEGSKSLGFELEMEKSFLCLAQQLEKEGKTIDYEYLYDIVYEDELSWKLNHSLSDSLGDTLEEFIENRGKQLFRF